MSHALTKARDQVLENIGRNTALRAAVYTGNIGTYASGGIAFDPTGGTDGTFLAVHMVLPTPTANVTYDFTYDLAAKKIMAFTTENGTEVGSVDISASTMKVFVIGTAAVGA